MSLAKIKDTDYLYISTRIKVLEKNMLSREKFQRMAAARTDDEAYKVLGENGYQGLESGSSAALEKSIAARRQEVLDLLYRYAPDRRVIDIFRLKYDYHNLKAWVKAEAQNVGLDGLLSDAGTIPSAKLVTALREHEEGVLSPMMRAAFDEAVDLLARTRDPQLSDVLLDQTMLEEMHQVAKATKSRFLLDYVRLYIDSANLRVVTRAIRAHKDADYLKRALCVKGSVPLDELATEPTAELIADKFGYGPLESAARAAAESIKESGDLAALDMACDNALLEYLRSARFIPFGEAQVITYLLLIENELTSVRIIMAGRGAGHSEEKILERLRLGYV